MADSGDGLRLAVGIFFFTFPEEVSCGYTMSRILLGTGSQGNARTMGIQELHQREVKFVGKRNEHKTILRAGPRPSWVTSLLVPLTRSSSPFGLGP